MRLLEHDSPTLDAIKMQVFYETNYSTREEYIFEHNEILEKRLSPMIAQITGKISRSQEGLETLYRQIIAAILIKSGIGSPTSIAVIREATAALQSVLPPSEIPLFASFNAETRKIHLQKLTDLVSGIRIYNFSIDHGGDGVDDLPELLDQAISATMDTLVEELKTLERLAAVYTAVYLKLAAVDDNPEVVSTANAIAIDAQKLGIDRHLLRGAIINVRQHALFLKQVRKDLMESRRNLAETKAQLLEHLKKASATLNEKVAVPSTEVNPIFIDIANRWSVLQNEMVFVSMLTNLMHSLQAFATRRQMRLTEETQMGFLRPGEVVYDADRAVTTGKAQPSPGAEHLWIYPKLKDHIRVDLQGFCAWSIVRYRGLLIPCTPGIGILRWKGKYYGFSSIQAAEEFEHAVEKFVFEISEVARRHPELIYVLQLQNMFSSGSAYFKDRKAVAESKRMFDFGIQTEIHPIESYIDSSYHWNEWELRRRALQMANIRRRLTHSVQTQLSNWRRDSATQVYLPKTQFTQTKRDYYSQVPTPSVFLHGLRGCGGLPKAGGVNEATQAEPYSSWCKVYRLTDHVKVDLTIPVEDQLLGSINGPDRPMH
uniref:Cilia- and flagella-associated protein 206 n=2 Tax=Schistocephalus solidus TaxID=70667 RepID=A0A0V0J203_SCHSO